jgi:glucose-1-phosphate thymidylyltransferase
VIGEDCVIGPGSYVGPYSSISNNVSIKKGEIENSIIMNDCEINITGRIVDSIIGAGSKITDGSASSPTGHRFLLGERSQVTL